MPRKSKKSNLGDSVTRATAPYRGFVKVEREPLDHPMFRGHMDWIGAWLLIQAAANYETNQVNLTDVGRRAAWDFGWDNEKWRRFVKRLEKEGFIKIVETKNFGDKIGHRQIALVLDPNSARGDMGSSIGAPRAATRMRSADIDDQSPVQMRSDEGGDEGPSEGAEGVVYKEQIKNKNNSQAAAVVGSSDEDATAHFSQNDYGGGKGKIGKEFDIDTPVTKHQKQANTALTNEDYSAEAQKARRFFADLIRGNFVEWLEKKIRDGDYRPDLFEYWYNEYSPDELGEAWKLAQSERDHRSHRVFGERLTYIDLLNDKIPEWDKAELRVWVRRHKEAKEKARLSEPLHYSDERSTKASVEVVLESHKLPSVIDIFDPESFEALDYYKDLDKTKVSRYQSAMSLLEETLQLSIYYLINAAPNPEVGVSFFLQYIAKATKCFPKSEDALVSVLKTLEERNMVECLTFRDDGYVNYRATDVSGWKVPHTQ